MRNRNTVEFLAVWEELHNPDFNRVQFEAVRSEAGLNRFVMTPTKWIEQTNAIGIVSKAGRYGGNQAPQTTSLQRKRIKLPMLSHQQLIAKVRYTIENSKGFQLSYIMKLFLFSFFLIHDVVILIHIKGKLYVRVWFSFAQEAHSLHMHALLSVLFLNPCTALYILK